MRLVLLVVAIVCFFLYMLTGFGAITLSHAAGWLGLGFVAFAGSFLPFPGWGPWDAGPRRP